MLINYFRDDSTWDDSDESDEGFIPESLVGPKAAQGPKVAIQEIEKLIKIPIGERKQCVQIIEEVG